MFCLAISPISLNLVRFLLNSCTGSRFLAAQFVIYSSTHCLVSPRHLTYIFKFCSFSPKFLHRFLVLGCPVCHLFIMYCPVLPCHLTFLFKCYSFCPKFLHRFLVFGGPVCHLFMYCLFAPSSHFSFQMLFFAPKFLHRFLVLGARFVIHLKYCLFCPVISHPYFSSSFVPSLLSLSPRGS